MDVLQVDMELERLGVEVGLQREEVKVEELKLGLIKEGKADESLITGKRTQCNCYYTGVPPGIWGPVWEKIHFGPHHLDTMHTLKR